MEDAPLTGHVIGVTAERRAEEQANLLRARGAQTLHGPTLRIFSFTDDEVLQKATRAVVDQPPDYLLASTGFGMRTWFAAAEGWGMRDRLVESLGGAKVLNRGAKAASANNAAGLREWWRAPNERFDETIERLLAEPLAGTTVAVQLHGAAAPGALARLRDAGATIVEVDAYRETLPDNRRPAHALIEAACAATLSAVTFTTAPAVHNLFVLAVEIGRADELRQAFNDGVIAACVGPVCAEGALDEGIAAPLVPSRSRLVPLIQVLTERLAQDS
ncbi:MAG: uroporphyrinogen-III synthase [Acidimicrobiales bacterium]